MNYESMYQEYAKPSMLRYLTNTLIKNADKIVAALFIGVMTLNVINILTPLVMFFFAVAVMLTCGLNVQINYLIGQGETKKAEKLFTSIFILGGISILLFALSLYVFRENVYDFLSVPDDLVTEVNKYYPLLIIFGIGLSFTTICNTAVIADRRPKYSAQVSILGALTNFVLNIIFVVAFDWGIEGLGIATIISTYLTLILTLGYFVLGYSRTFNFSLPNFDLKEMWFVVYNGSSELFTIMTDAVLLFVINTTIIMFLTEAHLDAFSVMSLVTPILFSVVYGSIMGILPIISEQLGKRDIEKGDKLFDYTARKTILICLVVYIVNLPLIYLVGSLLDTTDYLFESYTLYGLSQTVSVMTFGTTLYFSAIRKPLQSVLLGIVKTGIIVPFLTFISIMTFGAWGIGIGILFAEAILIYPFYKFRKKHVNLIIKTEQGNQIRE